MSTSQRRTLQVAVVTVLLDWATKWFTLARLQDDPIDLGWIAFRLRWNNGIAFSLGDSLPTAAVVAITGAVIVTFTVLAFRGLLQPPAAAGLIVGGGVGNLVDRMVNGAVVDMIELGWWPTFNVADVALNVGVGLILLWAFLHGDGDAEDAEDPQVERAGKE